MFEDVLGAIAQARAVLIGEQHERYDHHLTQLEIICRLHRIDPALAIGIEFVQTPYQAALDDFLAGRSDVEEFLAASEYYERWQYDFRLYAPILDLARQRRIPVLALNVPAELTRKVAAGGMGALSAADRAAVAPSIVPPDGRYRARLRAVFEQHPQRHHAVFEHFLAAQLLWDEGMAHQAARYLRAHPGKRLVVLAGDGHIAYRDAIPDRLSRAAGAPVLSLSQPVEGDARIDADFTLESATPLTLPRQGRLGVFLEEGASGVEVDRFTDQSAGLDAGMRRGDRIIRIDSREVHRIADLRIALWRALPGDRVRVLLRRDNASIELEVELR